MSVTLRSVLLLVFVFSISLTVAAQDCDPPKSSIPTRSNNIFSPEQEMVLGDLTYQRLAHEMHFVRDPQLVAYVRGIGDRLIKHLPETGLKFQFFIVDIPEANAFDVPGGYIFVSRKLIGFTNTEDELAGVIAHELGHAVVRHGASDFTTLLKKVLNVTQVGDRKDIMEKYNLLIERQRTKEISRKSEESEEQLEADRVGVFAMVAGGYDANAFASFFDRLVETNGKTGNWFTDIFGKANPDQKRLREMIKITGQIPPQCREMRQGASQEFLKWQADVVSFRETRHDEQVSGLLWKKELAPKLRSDVTNFAFSPAGNYFLAQDDFAITVIQREPLQVAFQIPAPDADDASFTPDGQSIVFGTENLRFEKWSVAERKPVQIRELVVRRDCWEHGFSPDGNYLVCFDFGLNLNIIDVRTGIRVWQKKEFYHLTFWEFFSWIAAEAIQERGHRAKFFNIVFSPDSKCVVVSRTNRFRYSFRIDGLIADESESTVLALDLNSLKPIGIGGDLKKMTHRDFVFLDTNRILGMGQQKLGDSGVFSFPDGKRLAKFELGGQELKATANPDYVIVKPLANAKMGIFNVPKAALVGAWNKIDAGLWNDLIVFESLSGKVTVSKLEYADDQKAVKNTNIGTIDIPVADIGGLFVTEVSDNLQWLAVSSKTRGAIWDLSSGDRKIYVRGFRGALVANDGKALTDFPKMDDANRTLAVVDPANKDAQPFQELPERGVNQYGRFLLLRQSLKDNKDKSDDKAKSETAPPDPDRTDESSLTRAVRFELKNLLAGKTVWTRDFPKEAPRFNFDSFSGRLILYWRLGSDVGKARLKDDPQLAARANELGNKDDDYLMEIVDAFTGSTVGTLLLETGKGSFFIRYGFSEGNWLVLTDNEHRVLVYSIKDGALRHRFFGSNAAVNPARNQIVVENYPGEVTVYDLDSGDSVARMNFGREVAFLRFTLDGRKLFVLSKEQTAYALDVDRIKVQPVAN